MTSFIRIARCPRLGLKGDQLSFRGTAESVAIGLSADTGAPDSAVCVVYSFSRLCPAWHVEKSHQKKDLASESQSGSNPAQGMHNCPRFVRRRFRVSDQRVKDDEDENPCRWVVVCHLFRTSLESLCQLNNSRPGLSNTMTTKPHNESAPSKTIGCICR